MAYIYRHVRLDKNEPFYIGVGQDKEKEPYFYTRAYCKWNRNKHWKNIVSKTEYEVEILEEDLSIEKALEKEIWWITFYGRSDLGRGTLVNMTDGGEGTTKRAHTVEARKKMSDAAKERFKNKEKKIKYKKILTDEDRKKNIEKFKNSRRGKKNTLEHNLKNSQSNAGENNGMFGKHHTDDTKKKLSIKSKGNQYAKGSKPNKETIEKRISTFKANITEEYREKKRKNAKGNQYAKGYKHTEESKEKIGDSIKLSFTEDNRRKLAERSKGNHYAKGHKHTEEAKKRMSEICKKRYENKKLSK